jgi:hypothetical protein
VKSRRCSGECDGTQRLISYRGASGVGSPSATQAPSLHRSFQPGVRQSEDVRMAKVLVDYDVFFVWARKIGGGSVMEPSYRGAKHRLGSVVEGGE